MPRWAVRLPEPPNRKVKVLAIVRLPLKQAAVVARQTVAAEKRRLC